MTIHCTTTYVQFCPQVKQTPGVDIILNRPKLWYGVKTTNGTNCRYSWLMIEGVFLLYRTTGRMRWLKLGDLTSSILMILGHWQIAIKTPERQYWRKLFFLWYSFQSTKREPTPDPSVFGDNPILFILSPKIPSAEMVCLYGREVAEHTMSPRIQFAIPNSQTTIQLSEYREHFQWHYVTYHLP
jgi:hypothetical protein